MISTPDRQTAIALIDDAVTAGARRAKACCELEISERTLELWSNLGDAHHQAARFSISLVCSIPSVNLIPSMTFGN
jgi:hypothetical protein